MKKLAFSLVFILAMVFVLGIAGTSDYDEQIILHMSEETYSSIVSELTQLHGEEPSQHQVVLEYDRRRNK